MNGPEGGEQGEPGPRVAKRGDGGEDLAGQQGGQERKELLPRLRRRWHCALFQHATVDVNQTGCVDFVSRAQTECPTG